PQEVIGDQQLERVHASTIDRATTPLNSLVAALTRRAVGSAQWEACWCRGCRGGWIVASRCRALRLPAARSRAGLHAYCRRRVGRTGRRDLIGACSCPTEVCPPTGPTVRPPLEFKGGSDHGGPDRR